MAETRERRQRRPRRPLAYLTIAALSAAVALGSAWEATRSSGAVNGIWRGKPVFVSQGKSRDEARPAP